MSAPARLRARAGAWFARERALAVRRRQADRLARGGVVDREYYQAQVGRVFADARAAAAHYLAEGPAAGYSVHPLFEPELVAARRRESPVDPLLDYLDGPPDEETSPHPLFDLAAARRDLEARGISTGQGVWLAWVLAAAPDTPVPVPSGIGPVSWGELRAELVRAAQGWRARTDGVLAADEAVAPQPGLTSIVVPAPAGLPAALRRVALLGDRTEARELVVVGVRRRSHFTCLSALALSRPIRMPGGFGDVAALWNGGAAASSGEVLVFVAPGARLGPGDVGLLGDALAEAGTGVAQPLNQTPEMTVASAGAYFPPADVVPTPLLAGHPAEDAVRPGRQLLPAALSGVVAVRRAVFDAVQGFRPEFGNDLAEVDLSRRIAEAGLGGTVLVPEARCTIGRRGRAYPSQLAASAELLRGRWTTTPSGSADVLAAAGFAVIGHRAQGEPELARPRTGLAALPSLRWTIDTAVTAGSWAGAWGDWHFAGSLARALRRLGQQVAVDPRQARDRDTRRFDDVVLTLRGLNAVAPRPGPVNLLWVISHPDDVTAEEVASYDAAFAASVSWSAERSAEWGVALEPLLQCTDAEYFNPGRADGVAGARVLFVGNGRLGAGRPIVEHAIHAGAPVVIYGPDWQGEARSHVAGERVANDELGRLYGRAGVVLNDHWEDMRAAGFVSNRLFDAVACCARVLSDAVAGADGLFGGSVLFCETGAEVEQALAEPLERSWPTDSERRAIAQQVLAEHSFDQRAEVLLARAIDVLRTRDER